MSVTLRSTSELRSELSKLIADYFGVSAAEIEAGTPLVDLLDHFDSLALLEIQTVVEEAYHTTLSLQSAPGGRLPANVDDVLAMLQSSLSGDARGH